MNKIVLIVFLTFHLVRGNEENNLNEDNPANATLIVLGQSGHGISTTVRKLLGPSKDIIQTHGGDQALIQIFKVPLPNGGFFRIVDVEGLQEESLIDDYDDNDIIEILSTLLSYLKDSGEGLTAQPTFFLVISKFDDTRNYGMNSVFTVMFKLVQILQETVYGKTALKTALLLTRLMRHTKTARQRPLAQIKQFRSAIRDFTSFSADSMEIIVGENFPEEYNLEVKNGQTTLPNKEYYPQNVFNSLLKVASNLNDTVGESVLRKFINRRNLQENITANLYSRNIKLDQIDLIESLSQAFKSFHATVKSQAISSFLQLQQYFQSQNLTTFTDLPNNTLDKVKFFETVPSDNIQLALLSTAFNFSMAKFGKHPVVGYGFDVRNDKFLLKTPFVADKFKASSIGYRLPNFISCSTIEPVQKVVYSICNENFDEYVATRMHFLGLHKDTTKSFQGKLRPGLIFELKGNETSVLSVVREFRTLKCELQPEEIHVNEQFKSTINNLGLFNSSDRDSVEKWVEFFENYGTHIVSIGYGGGSIEGRLEATSSQNLFDKLNRIVQFGTFSTQEMPNYKFFGGSWDKQINLHSLEQHERKNVLVSWKNSVKDDPIMFDFELSLIRISTYAKFANITLGEEVDKCVELYLAGRLAFLDPENTVGQGFNVLNESILVSTPFVKNNLKASSIGYFLPDFIKCSIIEPPTKRDIAYYNENFAEYAPTRLSLLGFERKVKFEGKVRMGFNIKPSESDTLLSLSTVREVRVIKCELVYNNETELNEEFKSVLNSLGPFVESDRDSVTEWCAFFEKYGTHIVSLGYGGGRIEGVFKRQSLKDIFKSKAKIQETLGKIVSFGRLQSEEVPIYTFFGGVGENQLENISSLEQHLRDGMLEKWISSLKEDPIMLKYELGLTPISTFAKSVNITVGEEVEYNLQIYLSGILKYKSAEYYQQFTQGDYCGCKINSFQSYDRLSGECRRMPYHNCYFVNETVHPERYKSVPHHLKCHTNASCHEVKDVMGICICLENHIVSKDHRECVNVNGAHQARKCSWLRLRHKTR